MVSELFQWESPDAFRVNGYLLDLNQVWAWYHSHTFGSHDPYRKLLIVDRELRKIDPSNPKTDWFILHWYLADINNIGYAIPDQAFSVYRADSFFYRDRGSDGKIGYGELYHKYSLATTYALGEKSKTWPYGPPERIG